MESDAISHVMVCGVHVAASFVAVAVVVTVVVAVAVHPNDFALKKHVQLISASFCCFFCLCISFF